MRPSDYTKIGGAGGQFMTTHWSLVEKAASLDQDPDRSFIGLLLNRYWKPVYCYIRRKGYDNERAKDLTQGFFHEVVLERRLIERVDSAKGRFRTFLLTALDRYLVNVFEKENAQKRTPKGKLISFEFTDVPQLPSSVVDAPPEDSFSFVWFAEMLKQVLASVEAHFRQKNKSVCWDSFDARILQPILVGTPPTPIEELCGRFGISDGQELSKMIYVVKRRLRSELRKKVHATVASDDAKQQEWKEIRRFFPSFT